MSWSAATRPPLAPQAAGNEEYALIADEDRDHIDEVLIRSNGHEEKELSQLLLIQTLPRSPGLRPLQTRLLPPPGNLGLHPSRMARPTILPRQQILRLLSAAWARRVGGVPFFTSNVFLAPGQVDG
ncbi:Calcium-binding component of the spindle pole body (SPB) half-bridge [Conoideocrella luteorostrata]|uniref:Calcium-binding component of the spindle pole body (SPB) half-bridge n=1 Tax=Conoideocrella luteorostrata TaxID=1105319 RepID=A0AAJ0CFC7_9HYPO|nr:Calcium-binding component of the spindle pole body (SPB) half-bridge [Conoideocrella luteorostrata]